MSNGNLLKLADAAINQMADWLDRNASTCPNCPTPGYDEMDQALLRDSDDPTGQPSLRNLHQPSAPIMKSQTQSYLSDSVDAQTSIRAFVLDNHYERGAEISM